MLSAVVSAGVLGLGALILDLVWLQTLATWPVSPGIASIVLFLIVLSLGLLLAHLRYLSWQYSLRENVMLVHFGVLWRMRRCIPRSRIQHVDIESGPIDRSFGLVNLSIFTAGTITAVATIPGLSPTEAEQLRERLIAAGHANV
jgi:uncharacterized protein